MRDVVRTPPQTPPTYANKKRRRRKRNLSLYYLMIFIFVGICATVLSLTVFFKISAINVTGETKYDKNSIISASGIKIGDNIFRTDYKKAEENIEKKLIYIDSAKITKTLSCQVTISVEPSVPYANIAYEKGYLLTSKTGKILETLSEPKENLPVIKGYEPDTLEPGEKLKSKNSENEGLFEKILNEINNVGMKNVTTIDISDKYNIKMSYEDRISIELGSISELEYKIKYANQLISSKISKTKEGTLFMLSGGQASFVSKKDWEKYIQNYETATVSESSTQKSEETTKKSTETGAN